VARISERPAYAVTIRRDDGSEFFAVGRDSLIRLMRTREKARQWQRALKTHGLHGRVVKVTITVEAYL
jgi:hypothetical protein